MVCGYSYFVEKLSYETENYKLVNCCEYLNNLKMDIEDIVLNIPVINVIEIEEQRRPRFHVRDDPFDLSDEDFIKIFRLNKHTASNLIDIIEPHLIAETRISAIDSVTKVIKF